MEVQENELLLFLSTMGSLFKRPHFDNKGRRYFDKRKRYWCCFCNKKIRGKRVNWLKGDPYCAHCAIEAEME